MHFTFYNLQIVSVYSNNYRRNLYWKDFVRNALSSAFKILRNMDCSRVDQHALRSLRDTARCVFTEWTPVQSSESVTESNTHVRRILVHLYFWRPSLNTLQWFFPKVILKCGLCVLWEYHVLDVLETVHVYTILDVLSDERLLQLRGIEYLMPSFKDQPTA